ncbi:putative solute carrier family 35 member E3 [Calycina marina]|uniref:GDP-mannose transporter n=1 Tax=Calycina marina TaxID=1763456 RepID=A0A9P7Z948_9HELO|nr:putative solute carrier family 35 member E3 [Calycina marina]
MAATIGIVFTNKAIFDDPSFKLMQTSFASFHFVCTGLTLYMVSRPQIAAFVPKRAGLVEMLPLALAMCLNVVLPNLSLAFSTVTVYQLARVLLTPMTAIINYVFFQQTIPRLAALVLIPVCAGVGITSYYDMQTPSADRKVATTSTIGIFFALSGVCASAAYTVLIGAYHKKLQMSSSQLLFNQAPIASVMLLFAVPVMDKIPDFAVVPMSRWMMILMSGGFASLINISQFFIVNSSGPVTSTVVGHLKTISIVSIGWAVSGRGVTDRSALGVLMTVGGILG